MRSRGGIFVICLFLWRVYKSSVVVVVVACSRESVRSVWLACYCNAKARLASRAQREQIYKRGVATKRLFKHLHSFFYAENNKTRQ